MIKKIFNLILPPILPYTYYKIRSFLVGMLPKNIEDAKKLLQDFRFSVD